MAAMVERNSSRARAGVTPTQTMPSLPRSSPLAHSSAEFDALTRTLDQLERERVAEDAAFLAEYLKEFVREASSIAEHLEAAHKVMVEL